MQTTLFEIETIEDFTEIPIRNFEVRPCSIQAISDFIERWHYSGNVNGIISDYCFVMTYENNIVGAAIFGRIAMAGVWKKYATKESDLLELRRLACVDKTKKNAESYLIGHCLRWIKNNTNVKTILSYADNNYGHTGTIYKATNFKYLGETAQGRIIIYNGKKYHDKCIRTKYNGKLKLFAKEVKEALGSGAAEYQKTLGKNIYLFRLQATASL
jgi:hypothetical protein